MDRVMQGRAEDCFLPGAVTFFLIFLSPQVNSLPPHLFSHFTWGGKEIMIDKVTSALKCHDWINQVYFRRRKPPICTPLCAMYDALFEVWYFTSGVSEPPTRLRPKAPFSFLTSTLPEPSSLGASASGLGAAFSFWLAGVGGAVLGAVSRSPGSRRGVRPAVPSANNN